ncbi:hypothetical protein HOY80DRAFT_856461, partial [Tuber brumale]
VPDLKDALLNSAESDLSSTEKFSLSQPPLMWPLRSKDDPCPENTRSALSLPVDRYFIIASFVCLLSFLVYIL